MAGRNILGLPGEADLEKKLAFFAHGSIATYVAILDGT